MSKTPTVRPSRRYPATASESSVASGTLTSWPDMRRPVNEAPVGTHPSSAASFSDSSVRPMPLSNTNRVSRPPAVTGTTTRCSRYSNGTRCIKLILLAYYAPMATAAILGCAGYTGQETLDRLLAHPELEPVALGSDSLAGQRASALDPRLNGDLPAFVTERRGARGRRRRRLPLPRPRGRRCDRPAGRRARRRPLRRPPARDASLYAEWYGFEHPRPGAWSYGLPELFEPEPPLVANPGCYATAALLALAPLAGVIDTASVVVDAKSGVSGAGRGLKASSHAGFVLENLTPYRVGDHQHAPEIEQALGFPVCFVPHLLPVRRGLLATCYVHDRRATRARCSRTRTQRRRRCASSTRASRPTSRACSTRTPRRSPSTRTARRDGRSSPARSTTSAREQPATPSRTRTSRSASTRPPGLRLSGVLV